MAAAVIVLLGMVIVAVWSLAPVDGGVRRGDHEAEDVAELDERRP